MNLPCSRVRCLRMRFVAITNKAALRRGRRSRGNNSGAEPDTIITGRGYRVAVRETHETFPNYGDASNRLPGRSVERDPPLHFVNGARRRIELETELSVSAGITKQVRGR